MPTGNPRSEPLIFPVGHYAGAIHLEQDGQLDHHAIRVGTRIVQLDNDIEFKVWALLHGLGPGTDESLRWTRETVEYLADESDLAGAGFVIEKLLHRKAAVQVKPGSEQVATFAAKYRLRPMLYGLGNNAEEPAEFGIGLPGNEPLLKLTLPEYELWQWSPSTPSLAKTIELLTTAWKNVGMDDPRFTDPDRRLNRDLRTIHSIISHGAGYLDLAGPAAAA